MAYNTITRPITMNTISNMSAAVVTLRIRDPARVATGIQPRRDPGVAYIRFVGLFHMIHWDGLPANEICMLSY